MITELGHFCLILAMLVAFLQCVVPFLGTRKNSYGMMNSVEMRTPFLDLEFNKKLS